MSRVVLRAVAAALVIALMACAKMGAPSGGVVDRTPPRVIGHSPRADATGVERDRSVAIEFSEGMDRRRTREAVFLAPRSQVTFKWSARKLEFVFDDGLQADQTYVVTVGTDARDLRGNSLEQSFVFAFGTGSDLNQGRITGRVFRDGKAAVAAFVWAYDVDRLKSGIAGQLPAYETQSGRDGTYVFSRLSPGRYRILAFVDGNRNKLYDADEILALPSADVAVKGAAQDSVGETSGDLVLRETGSSTPKLVRAQALDRRRVLLLFDRDIEMSTLSVSIDGLSVEGVHAAPQDAKRVYVLTTPQEGSRPYRIALTSADQPIEWDEPVRGSNRSDSKAPSVDYFEPAKGQTTGGDSLVILFSEAMDISETPRYSWVRSDSTGAPAGAWHWRGFVRLVFLPSERFESGSHLLRASTDGLTDRAGNAIADSTVEFAFEVSSAEELAGISGTVSGNSAGAAVWVVAENSTGGATYRVMTDAVGGYEFSDMLPGKYILHAFADGNGNGVAEGGVLDPFAPAEATALRVEAVDVVSDAVVEQVDFELR